jgi:type IV fimbrial biogenesis protein FimT
MPTSQILERLEHPRCGGRPSRLRSARRGFSLIELIIGIAIVSLLLALGIPTFQSWVINSQIRDGTEAILNGIQVARANAIQRNLLVVFALTPQNGATPASWSVDLDTGVTEKGTKNIQTWSAAEGGTNTVITPAAGTKLYFNGIGQRVVDGNGNNPDGSDVLTQVDVSSSAAATADIRTLRVVVGAGGSVKMCDPQLAAGDPRAC